MLATIAPGPTEQAERTKAVWYAFGAIDAMRQNGATDLDAIDASDFAVLFGTCQKAAGLAPTVATAWAAYVELRTAGRTRLSADDLAAHAATIARR